jgi:ribosomal protein S18 acetylase RimI-like enzyme
MAMKLRRITEEDLAETYVLLAENGWAHRLGSVAEFRALVSASQIATVATVNEEIVGFIRALTDKQSNGYLSMLVVSEKYRRQGIGRALVESVVGSHSQVTWVLRAGREGAATFFAKLGFESSSIAMERRRL